MQVIAWMKTDPVGAEFVEVERAPHGLRATGTAIGSDPEPYRLDYALETDAEFVTRHVQARTRGQGWARTLRLTNEDGGGWRIEAEQTGHFAGPAPGGDAAAFAAARDADLGLSPLFNSMPVLRHHLLESETGAVELLMVWISVPDLQVRPSRQRYTPVRPGGTAPALVRFETVEDGAGFRAEIEFDSDGFVVDYPGLATRLASVDDARTRDEDIQQG